MHTSSLSAVAPKKVAVVDDDESVRSALHSLLRASGMDVQVYGSAEDYLDAGLTLPSQRDAACLIVDVSMPGMSGPELVRGLRADGQRVPTIFISAREAPSGENLESDALQSSFLRKPFGDDVLLAAVEAAIGKQQPATPLQDRRGFERLVGSDGGLASTVHRARLLSNASAPLLLSGETGVGKQTLARAIHENSSRAAAPFVSLHCAGLPRELLQQELFGYLEGAFPGARAGGLVGKLAAADGGTLFLEDIDGLPSELQPWLLRVLEGGEFYPLGSSQGQSARFRLITSSSRDLRAEAQAGRFHMDLFFRIAVTAIEVPPLRERLGDLPALVDHFAEVAAQQHQLEPKVIAPEVISTFARHSWPGNLRELCNTVESMMLLSEQQVVDLSVLPSSLAAQLASRPPVIGLSLVSDDEDAELPRGLQRIERAAIAEALQTYGGNLTRVARELRIARSTLYLKLKKYGLEPALTELRFGTR